MAAILHQAALGGRSFAGVMDHVRDGFPVDVRISHGGRITRFRFNLAAQQREPDARVDLAKAVFALGKMLIDRPSSYAACTTDGRIITGEA